MIIDRTIRGTSNFDRMRPLAPNTTRRIVTGLRKFGGPLGEQFLVMLRNDMDTQSIDDPLPAITANVAAAQFEFEPFVLGDQCGCVSRSTDGSIGAVESELTRRQRPLLEFDLDRAIGAQPGVALLDEPASGCRNRLNTRIVDRLGARGPRGGSQPTREAAFAQRY